MQGSRRRSGWGGLGHSTFQPLQGAWYIDVRSTSRPVIYVYILVSDARMIDRGSVEKIPKLELGYS